MAKPGRPASENYQPVCSSVSQSVSYSSRAESEGLEDEDDKAPIFSLSKSSMDVVMATGPPHKRDPAWTRMDLKRSSSANTHSDQGSLMRQQLHPHVWQQVNNLQAPLTAQHVDALGPPAIGERWLANMQRWSECSGSTYSRSSTPDTVIWKGGSSRPCSLSQEPPCSSVPDSPMSKTAYSPTTPSPFISPLQTPTLPPVDISSFPLNPHQQGDSPTTSPLPSPPPAHTNSPLPSPMQVHTNSPLPSPLLAHTSSPLPSPLQAQTNSPLPSPLPAPTASPLPSPLPVPTTSPVPSPFVRLTDADDECFLENNLLSFQYPSPITSSVSLKEGCESSDPGCLADGAIEEPPSSEDMLSSEVEGVRSPVQMSCDSTPNSVAEGQESGRGASVSHLQLPWPLGQRCWKSPLVSSLSDSRLRECSSCDFTSGEGITHARKVEVFREEGTMTSRLEMVDVAVQTVSPVSSWWDLRRNISTSNMGSHSILGSPPGSRLNLKSSVGSHSNLVSPSSSMFPASSGEEEEEEERQGDDPTWAVNSVGLHDLERRRSCLKIQGDDKDELGRRSSMKQVQWDEDGMTWDVHGASVDPEELSTAIRKHLELKNSPRPTRRTSKKKKAPKPPLISEVVKAMTPELNPPAMVITSTCIMEGESEETPEATRGREAEEEGGGQKEETVEAACRINKTEGENVKEKEEKVLIEEGTSHPKSPSNGHSRKRSVIRSLRRPGVWCGGSRKVDD